MIDKVSLSPRWLEEKRQEYRKDPGIIEAMIYALYLLEQLKLTGLEFIFKGGTCLVLLMKRPLRFSVDIDIIVSPGLKREDLEIYLNKILSPAGFPHMELDERRSYKEGVPKAHYKFLYTSNVPNLNKEGDKVTNPEREILLDILFAENPYPVVIETKIQSDWIMTAGEPLTVQTPDINSIAGDKLVAFAPTTTGVPYGASKEREIIKQLFDVGNLFLTIDNVEIFKASYYRSATAEMKYRAERNIQSVEHCLRDTIATGLIIARRESHALDDHDSKMKYAEIITGIRQFGHFVADGSFRIDHAQVASARAAYLAAAILSGADKIEFFDPAMPIADYLITHPEYNFLNKKLKGVAKGEALFYWHRIVTLLNSKNNDQGRPLITTFMG